jgi:hypothetical protein
MEMSKLLLLYFTGKLLQDKFSNFLRKPDGVFCILFRDVIINFIRIANLNAIA